MRLSEGAYCAGILAITAIIVSVEVFGSTNTGSLALLGDGVHMLGDGLPFVGTLLLTRPWLMEEMEEPVERAIRLLNRTFLLCGGAYLAAMGAYHILYPREIGRAMILYAAAGFVGNSTQAYFAHQVRHVHRHESTHRGLMLHLVYDIAVSGAVLIAAAVIWATGWSIIDAVLSLPLGLATIWAIKHIDHANEDHSHAHVHSGG